MKYIYDTNPDEDAGIADAVSIQNSRQLTQTDAATFFNQLVANNLGLLSIGALNRRISPLTTAFINGDETVRKQLLAVLKP